MEAGERPRIGRRRLPRVLGILFALAVVAALIVAHYLQPAQLTALILSRASDSLHLQLHTSGPGSYALRPEPRLVLPGLTATVPGNTSPFFHSDRVELALPWNTLRGKGSDISSIVLKSPDLDLQGLDAWLATLPPSKAAFKLPTLTRGLQVSDGTLRGANWKLEHLDLALPALADGRAATIDAAGVLARASASSRFALHATATAAGIGHGLRIDGAQVSLKADGELPSLTADGNLLLADTMALDLRGSFQQIPATWSGATDSSFAKSGDTPFSIALSKGPPKPDPAHPLESLAARHAYRLDATLGNAKREPTLTIDAQATTGAILDARVQGRISRWPDAWPGLPSALAADTAPILFQVSYQGPVFLAEPFAFAVRRSDAVLQGNLKIADLRAWARGGFASILPPVQATLDAPLIDVGGVRLRGVHAETSDDAPPPAAPAPAAVPRS